MCKLNEIGMSPHAAMFIPKLREKIELWQNKCFYIPDQQIKSLKFLGKYF